VAPSVSGDVAATVQSLNDRVLFAHWRRQFRLRASNDSHSTSSHDMASVVDSTSSLASGLAWSPGLATDIGDTPSPQLSQIGQQQASIEEMEIVGAQVGSSDDVAVGNFDAVGSAIQCGIDTSPDTVEELLPLYDDRCADLPMLWDNLES
jgi:hypothetical protein